MPDEHQLETLSKLRPDILDGDPERLVRWTDLGTRSLQWQSRNEAIAALIQDHAIVLDMGCGTMGLKTFLPEGCTYIPADIVRRSEDCHVIDLNNGIYPPATIDRVDCVVFSGVLEYLHDVTKALKWAASVSNRVIATYAVLETNPGVERRIQKSGFFNHYPADDIKKIFTDLGFAITDEQPWRKQMIFDLKLLSE